MPATGAAQRPTPAPAVSISASSSGNFTTCLHGECRRTSECCSRRDEDAMSMDLAVFPPCVPFDLDIIETYRVEIQREMRILAREYEHEMRERE